MTVLWQIYDSFLNILGPTLDKSTKIFPLTLLNPVSKSNSFHEWNQLILCGGTSKIPKIQKAAAGVFDSAEVLSSVGPDEVNAYGAAIQAGMVTEKRSYPGGTSVAVKVMKSAISFTVLGEEVSEVSVTKHSLTALLGVPPNCAADFTMRHTQICNWFQQKVPRTWWTTLYAMLWAPFLDSLMSTLFVSHYVMFLKLWTLW